jgi:hypothetical protein
MAQKLAASERSVACAVTRLAMLVAVFSIVGSYHEMQGNGGFVNTEGLGQYNFVDPSRYTSCWRRSLLHLKGSVASLPISLCA